MMPLTGQIESSPDPRDWDFENSELYGGINVTWSDIDTDGDGHIERDQYAQNCVHYALNQAIQDLDRKIVTLGLPVRVAITKADGSFALDDDGAIALAPDPVTRKAPLDLLAPMFSYGVGRLLKLQANGMAVPEDGLEDVGSSYRFGIMALRDVENGGGARLETLYPDVPRNARRLPPAHVMQGDPLVKIGGYYRIKGEGRPTALRDGIMAALTAYNQGKCSKPCTAMQVTEGFVNTPPGQVYDARNPGERVGGHAMLVKAYNAADDTVDLHQTWIGRPRTYRVRIDDLAAAGGETWVLKNLIYIPRVA